MNFDSALCTFCGNAGDLTVGTRALICDDCRHSLRKTMAKLARPPHDRPAPELAPAGHECCFCNAFITDAPFSMRRWIFSICNECGSTLAFDGAKIEYEGDARSSYSYRF